MGVASRFSLQRAAETAWSVLAVNWHHGFTAFGGPPVHFKIFHDKFVKKLGWVDEQIYQEVFAICQAFSGPGSTKLLYCLNLIHFGFLPAVLAFFIWSLPGALGMYGLSVGVSRIGDTLPPQVYALLSGLNAATVGIVALAAVELSQKAITNKMTRILVFLGACAGLLYNALWYFPLLMFLGGLAAVIHDYRVLHGPVIWIARLICRGKAKSPDVSVEMAEAQRQDESHRGAGGPIDATPVPVAGVAPAAAAHSSRSSQKEQSSDMPVAQPETRDEQKAPRIIPQDRQINMSWKHGAAVLAMFIVSFIVFMVLRGTLPNPSLLYQLFANMYLAGTIIFGGGPVVIPLLREYVVVEGWVSPRDFLIGLAIIQAFPGPNFNFAVYLGGLTAIGGGYNSAVGAVLAYLGIFVPGLVTVYGEMGLWSALRSRRWVKSGLRGINASAVGLIYAAVYRLWQIGYIDQGFQSGRSLADDPWWVVVTATSYVGGYWFGLKPPVAIILGAVMGLIRYGVVTK